VTFYDWKALSITQVIIAELQKRVENYLEELAQSAGVDPLEDRRKCGIIAAYREIINIHEEDTVGN
jgi:hypothetical protein